MEEKRIFVINRYDYNFLLNVLNEYRHQLLRQGKSTELVNEMLLKLINTPMQKKALFRREKARHDR